MPQTITSHEFTLTNNFQVYVVSAFVGDVKCGTSTFTAHSGYYSIATCAENIVISKNDIEVFNAAVIGTFK